MKWSVPVGILKRPAVRDRRRALASCRISRSCSGVHDVLAGTGDDIAAAVTQADRHECREPLGEFFCKPAGISYGPSGFRQFT